MLDTHCHVDQFNYPHDILEDLRQANVETISVTNLPSHFIEGYPFYKGFKTIHPALGFHPLLVNPQKVDIETELKLFKKKIFETEFVGEIGLDFSVPIKLHKKQIEIFEKIIKISASFDKITSIHSRKAEEEVLRVLLKNNVRHAILHWFTGSISQAKRAEKEGYYFSINQKLVRTKKGRIIASCINPELILTETDAPFTASSQSKYPNEDLKLVYQFLSDKWGTTVEDAIKRVKLNYERLLKRNPIKKVA